MDYIKVAEEILQLLNSYLIYFIPGYISIWEYSFLKGKHINENINIIIKSIIVSYLYVKVSMHKDWVTIIIAFIVPYIYYLLQTFEWFDKVLKFMRINTSITDNVLDLIQNKEKKKKAVNLKLFMDEKGIMYEGQLRVHESDNQKEQVICLSGYRRYIKNDVGKYEVKNDYNGDKKRWVLLKYNDADRIEVQYADEK